LLEIHRRVKKGIRADRGRFRNRQNWIGPEGGSIEEGRYFPPKASQVSGYMKNLQAYLNHPEKDKLVQWAVYFAQFLAIHPFMDGNGRVVRVLTPVFLSQKKLLSYPLFYISGYFKRHYGAYYDKLFDISNKDDWKGWIEFFLKGIIEEGERNCKKALKLARLYKKWAGVLSKDLPPQLARKTLDFIFENPVFIQHQFRSRCRCSSAAQKKIFKDLKIQKTRRKMVCQPILSLF
jgi:Fic family protein